MRTRTKQWLILASILGITLMLSGCFFSEQTLVIGPDGKADVKVEFWFDKIQAGDQGSIAIQELLYLFPELQDYEMTRTEKRIEYSTYLVYGFRANDVDINRNRYIDFVKKDDGSYSLTVRIPKAIEEKKEKNDKVLIVRVTMPAEIDIANTIDFSGNTAKWELRTNDFTSDITLKVFTKVPLEKETREKISHFSTQESAVKTLMESMESMVFGDKELADRPELDILASRAVMKWRFQPIVERNYPPKVLTVRVKEPIGYLPAKRKEEGAPKGRGRAIEAGRKIERQVEPPYPEWAQREGITGAVVVEVKCWVLPSGDVRNVEVCQSSGSPRLDEHVCQYLLKWKFEPIEGQEVQWGIVPFHFEFPEK